MKPIPDESLRKIADAPGEGAMEIAADGLVSAMAEELLAAREALRGVLSCEGDGLWAEAGPTTLAIVRSCLPEYADERGTPT